MGMILFLLFITIFLNYIACMIGCYLETINKVSSGAIFFFYGWLIGNINALMFYLMTKVS